MTNPTSDPLPLAPDLVPGVRIKAALLLVLLFSLLLASGLFLLKSRGFFDPTQRLVLVADNSEGVAPGMNLTFSGFPIGQVRRADSGCLRCTLPDPHHVDQYDHRRGVLQESGRRAVAG
jgi:hypothetical protein